MASATILALSFACSTPIAMSRGEREGKNERKRVEIPYTSVRAHARVLQSNMPLMIQCATACGRLCVRWQRMVDLLIHLVKECLSTARTETELRELPAAALLLGGIGIGVGIRATYRVYQRTSSRGSRQHRMQLWRRPLSGGSVMCTA